MAEKTTYSTASTFTSTGKTKIQRSSASRRTAVTAFTKNASYGGTPDGSDYICMSNRRKYIYNEKK